MAEAGVPGYEADLVVRACYATAGTPAADHRPPERRSGEDPRHAGSEEADGRTRRRAEPGEKPAQFAAFIVAETAKWGKVVKESARPRTEIFSI